MALSRLQPDMRHAFCLRSVDGRVAIGGEAQALARVDIVQYIGRRKLFRYQDDCQNCLHSNLNSFTDLAHFTRVMTPEFGGALRELEAQRFERPKVFAIGQLLEHGLSISLAKEGQDPDLEEVWADA